MRAPPCARGLSGRRVHQCADPLPGMGGLTPVVRAPTPRPLSRDPWRHDEERRRRRRHEHGEEDAPAVPHPDDSGTHIDEVARHGHQRG